MFLNSGGVKIIYKSKFSKKITFNRKTAANLKKMSMHGGTPKNFWDCGTKL